jgi:hypothetical protein
MADRGEQVGDVVVVKPVVRVAAGPSNDDQTRLAEEPKLLRGRAGPQPRQLDELLDRSLAREHRPEQTQSAPRAEDAHRLCQLLRLVERKRTIDRFVVGRLRHDRTVATPAQMFIRSRDPGSATTVAM